MQSRASGALHLRTRLPAAKVTTRGRILLRHVKPSFVASAKEGAGDRSSVG